MTPAKLSPVKPGAIHRLFKTTMVPNTIVSKEGGSLETCDFCYTNREKWVLRMFTTNRRGTIELEGEAVEKEYDEIRQRMSKTMVRIDTLDCGHQFCGSCFKRYIVAAWKADPGTATACPICLEPIEVIGDFRDFDMQSIGTAQKTEQRLRPEFYKAVILNASEEGMLCVDGRLRDQTIAEEAEARHHSFAEDTT